MILNLKSSTDLSGFYIIFEGATNIETQGLRGASHLLEHLICRLFHDLRNDFQKNAIDWNATTSNNYMSFYFTGLDDNLNRFKNKIIDRIFDFDITKKQFELEKKIILEEYTDSFNKQSRRHLLNLMRKKFNFTSPIGYKEDLDKLRWIDLLKFYEENYINPTKIVNISKKYKFENSSLSFVKPQMNKKWEIADYPIKLEGQKEEQKKSSIIFLTNLQDENINTMKFLAKVLGYGLDSPLSKEIREKKGLCYSINCEVLRLNKQATLKIQTNTQKEKEEQTIEAIKKVLKSIKNTIRRDRVDLIKSYLKVQQKKDDINRFKNIVNFIIPEEYTIYYGIDKVNHKKIIEIGENLLDPANLIISRDKDMI